MSVGRAGHIVLLIASVTAFGCVHTVTHHVAAFQTGLPNAPVTKPAPESAVYRVKVFDHGKYRGVGGTERLVSRGDALGFRTDSAGTLHGVAGDEDIPLRLPPRRSVVWYTAYEKQTQFGREVERAVGAAGDAATTAGTLGLIGAAAATESYLDSLADDDCDHAAGRGQSARDHDGRDHHDHHHDGKPTTRP